MSLSRSNPEIDTRLGSFCGFGRVGLRRLTQAQVHSGLPKGGAGSNPAIRIFTFCTLGSIGRASRYGREGCRFDSYSVRFHTWLWWIWSAGKALLDLHGLDFSGFLDCET